MLQAATAIIWTWHVRLNPFVCFVVGVHCPGHRMCVGVVGSETGWKAVFTESHTDRVSIDEMGSGEHVRNVN